jgi:hypothetical protein
MADAAVANLKKPKRLNLLLWALDESSTQTVIDPTTGYYDLGQTQQPLLSG